MKTISIRLEDTIYEELSEMLNAMGQTKQTFYESFTRTALRESQGKTWHEIYTIQRVSQSKNGAKPLVWLHEFKKNS